MQINLGGIDRGLRVIAGVALLVWAFMGGPVWAWIGLVPLATAAVGFCPLYRLLGLRTCRDPAACAIKP
jgi:hypothetical protein